MKILQISNDFAGSKVHSNLFQHLDAQGIEQVVYCPIRNPKLFDSNKFEGQYTDFIYSFIIKPWYKFLYHYKRRVLYRMKNKVDLKSIDLIHAATLFSDGGLAYKAYKEFHVPYVIAVRNTDINDFAKLQLASTWVSGKKILLSAQKIYFSRRPYRMNLNSLGLFNLYYSNQI